MRVWPWIWVLGCTDYDFKSVQENELGEDTAEVSTSSEGDDGPTSSDETDTNQDPNNEDNSSDEECTESYVAFNIEEVSTLQDAVSLSVAGWNQDAVVLSFDDSILSANQTWRVSAVEILVLISDAYYPHFTDGQEINIQVFDAPTPQVTSFWTMTKGIVRSEHNWMSYTLPQDAYHASLYGEFQQQGTWVRFNTTEVIPSSGMGSSEFLVGVMWEEPGMVKVGYSNFNQDCERNWSNYGSGWGLNSENPEFFGCSWPMMRVEIEIITHGDC